MILPIYALNINDVLSSYLNILWEDSGGSNKLGMKYCNLFSIFGQYKVVNNISKI